jgi:hypothetical protein
MPIRPRRSGSQDPTGTASSRSDKLSRAHGRRDESAQVWQRYTTTWPAQAKSGTSPIVQIKAFEWRAFGPPVDEEQLKRTEVREEPMKSERDGINPAAKPSGTGCVECLALGGWWLHLRRCAECGHIGCCDGSPYQHASKHNAATGHPIITSFEPDERWFYDYRTEEFFTGPKLHAPHSHPLDQPVPGPAGAVPSNWQTLLHE